MLDSVHSVSGLGPGLAEPDPEAEVPNIGAACSDALCAHGLGGKVALRFIPRGGERESITYAQLAAESSRFANVLGTLGYQAGESIFLCATRQPAVCYAFLGALKARVVAGMLFSSFGEEALADRLGDANARGLLTTKRQLRKLDHLRARLPALRHAVVLDIADHESDFVLSFPRLMRESRAAYLPGRTTRATPSVLHYTSGSTGKPKGVVHGHGALAYLRQTTRDVLGLRPDDVYWCTADPGWVTGSSYGMIGPWSLGVTQIQLGGNYDGAAWMCALEEEEVSVWYTAPTALRMLMREPPAVFESLRLPRLRHLASVGEPLNPEVIAWGRRTLGLDIHDTWFQTETGGILIANRAGLPIRPGSMGKPVAGIEAAILDEQGAVLPERTSGPPLHPPGLALHVPRLPATTRGDRRQVHGRLLRFGRPRPPRRRRLLLVRGAHRRRHQHRRAPGQPLRDRKRAPGTARGGGVGGHRRAGRHPLREGRGLRGLCDPASSRLPGSASSCASPSPTGSRPTARPGTWFSSRRCPRPRAARSCAGCYAPATSGCRKAICRASRIDTPSSSARLAGRHKNDSRSCTMTPTGVCLPFLRTKTRLPIVALAGLGK